MAQPKLPLEQIDTTELDAHTDVRYYTRAEVDAEIAANSQLGQGIIATTKSGRNNTQVTISQIYLPTGTTGVEMQFWLNGGLPSQTGYATPYIAGVAGTITSQAGTTFTIKTTSVSVSATGWQPFTMLMNNTDSGTDATLHTISYRIF